MFKLFNRKKNVDNTVKFHKNGKVSVNIEHDEYVSMLHALNRYNKEKRDEYGSMLLNSDNYSDSEINYAKKNVSIIKNLIKKINASEKNFMKK